MSWLGLPAAALGTGPLEQHGADMSGGGLDLGAIAEKSWNIDVTVVYLVESSYLTPTIGGVVGFSYDVYNCS